MILLVQKQTAEGFWDDVKINGHMNQEQLIDKLVQLEAIGTYRLYTTDGRCVRFTVCHHTVTRAFIEGSEDDSDS